VNTEFIVYLLRKTTLTRSEIGKLTPSQFSEILKEVAYQESVEDYHKMQAIASILAAIYNTIPRKRGSRMSKPEDFLKGEMPQRNSDSLDKLAEGKGIKLPTKELKER